ncbi:hypothetical protein L2E82_32424 [Cichorium intybus]|uniref:Uncharacterized protein n=1 Tax=Cichorium intybus TaxID=13427 RepID=A0ACB9BGE5_CICIN|nr:hypothetical protein L2E82_32424 [Cichorium intybus]
MCLCMRRTSTYQIRMTQRTEYARLEMLSRKVQLDVLVRSELETSGQVLERMWIGVEGSSRAPTIESTGSAFESGVGHEESN